MTPEEKQLLTEINERLKNVEEYTTTLRGKLEFNKVIERIVKDAVNLQINGNIKHTGNKVGFYNSTPVVQANHIANPTGGSTTDSQARTAINAILVVLENAGLTKTS